MPNSLLELLILEDALRVALDGDFEAGVHELLGRGGRERRAVLKLLRLAAKPELQGRDGEGRCEISALRYRCTAL